MQCTATQPGQGHPHPSIAPLLIACVNILRSGASISAHAPSYNISSHGNIATSCTADWQRRVRRPYRAHDHRPPLTALSPAVRQPGAHAAQRDRQLAARGRGFGVPDGGGRRHHAADRIGPVDRQMGCGLRHAAAAQRRAMAGGVRRLSDQPAISEDQQRHDAGRVQIDLLLGICPPPARPADRHGLRPAFGLVRVEAGDPGRLRLAAGGVARARRAAGR